jgi:hypothetical protein
MKDILSVTVLILMLTWSSASFADRAHQDHSDSSRSVTVEHGQGEGTFTHQTTAEGVRAEFQVMSLASMNMQDPKGNTHHVMVKLFNETSQTQIKNATGQIRIIGPSGKERKETLTNYNGILAASFTFDEKGKYKMIFVFDGDGKKGEITFWYPGGSW